MRDYCVDGQLGLEPTPDEYIANLVAVFRECKRILRDDGTLWVNIGDSYASNGCYINAWMEKESNKDKHHLHSENYDRYADRKAIRGGEGNIKGKDLIGIPWMLAFALRADGWYLRSDIIWAKKNCMPESVKDRPTKSHEYIFLLSKSAKYYYDSESIKEESVRAGDFNNSKETHSEYAMHRVFQVGETRNKRDVWFVSTKPYKGAHYATFNPELITPCILAGAPETCCAKCGAPYKRIVTVIGKQVTESMRIAGCNNLGEYNGQATKDFESAKAQNASDTKRRILESMSQIKDYEWKPTCTCNAGTTSGIVFDPFVGSGTTVATAIQLGRRGIGLDLSMKYLAENAKTRIDEMRLPLLELVK